MLSANRIVWIGNSSNLGPFADYFGPWLNRGGKGINGHQRIRHHWGSYLERFIVNGFAHLGRPLCNQLNRGAIIHIHTNISQPGGQSNGS